MGWLEENKEKNKPFLTKVRDSFRGQRKKELLTFFVFLIISSFFWFLQWMKESITTQTFVPIELINIPRNVLLTSDLPKNLTVTIKDKGATILSYYFSRPIPKLQIDYNELQLKRGTALIAPDEIIAQLQKKFVSSVEITSIFPESLTIRFSRGESKIVPVSLLTSISTSATCGISGSIQVFPATVTVYAPKDKLQEIERVFTETIKASEAKDTIKNIIALKKLEGVKIVPSSVSIVIPVEPFTEKEMEIPIESNGVPVGFKMRVFPVKTNVICRVALSKYDQVKTSDFRLVADYSPSQTKTNTKYPIRLVRSPKYVSKVRFQPSEVEVLIEDEQ